MISPPWWVYLPFDKSVSIPDRDVVSVGEKCARSETALCVI